MVRGRNPAGRPQQRIPLVGPPQTGPRELFLRKSTGALVDVGLRYNGDPFALSRNAYLELSRVFKRANDRSVEWLKDRAVTELQRSYKAHGRPASSRSKNLVRTIKNDKLHESSESGFTFFKFDEAAKLAPYFRAIEEGSTASVGRIVPIDFRSGNTGRPVLPNRRRYPKDALLSGSGRAGDRGVRFVRVQTPIPAYRYLERTRAAFKSQSVYYRYLTESKKALVRLAPAGVTISVTAGTRPGASI